MSAGRSREPETAVEKAIASATAKHMSNAKWRQLFFLLEQLGVRELRWKLLCVERAIAAHVPTESSLLPERFGDTLPAPYSQYRDIEWVEVPNEYEGAFAALLSAERRFPWRRLPEGLRLTAYSWQ